MKTNVRTKWRNKNAFTLAELLIVVAIIGVLIAISIPIFASQLEKSRDAVTAANLRSAYAEACDIALTENEKIVTGLQITAMGRTGDLGGFDRELPFFFDSDSIYMAGAGGGKKLYVTFDFTREDYVTVLLGTSSYVGQKARANELSNDKFYFSDGKIAIEVINENDPDAEPEYLIREPEINKVYEMWYEYADSANGIYNGYYKYDGTNWYWTEGEGKKWYVYSPPSA